MTTTVAVDLIYASHAAAAVPLAALECSVKPCGARVAYVTFHYGAIDALVCKAHAVAAVEGETPRLDTPEWTMSLAIE